MKQEASKKSKLWLWLVIGAVALLAIAGVVLALVLGSGSGDQPSGGRPELYWNVDRIAYTANSETGLSTREPGEDGLYHVRFAYMGELMEYPVADKPLINYIDTMDAMGLVVDADGVIVDVIDPKELATEVTKNAYVKDATDTKIVANSSIAMNGMNINVEFSQWTQIYDVTPGAEQPGKIITYADLLSMDTLTVYANDLGEVTHVYVTSHPKQSKVYWRADQFYNSSLKETSRVPDENGVYTIPFFCDGELVELKTKDKTIATKVDSTSRWKCHFGFTFDDEGYIVEYFNSALGISGVIVADCWDVVSIEGDYYTIQRLTTNDGSMWSGTIDADCIIYDASAAAKSEKRGGKQVESLSVGDRVTVWTDTTGKPVLVYIGNHIVDSPAYWVPTRKYSTSKKETTRTPNWQGYYEVELFKEGTNSKQTYYIKDKETMSYLDSQTSKCVGLKVGEGNIVEYVYDSESLTGYTCRTKGGIVTAVTGSVITKIAYGKRGSDANFVLTPDARVYNVSAYGQYGEVTTIQPGDHIYGYAQPTGELCLVFVSKRTIGGDHLYWRLDAQYDSKNKVSTREPDADGWYYIDFAYKGKQVTLRTQNKTLVDKIDALSIGAVALDVSGDKILKNYDATYAYGGNKIASGYRFRYITEEGKYHCVYNSDSSKTVEFKMAEDCVIYNVSPVYKEYQGERIYSIPYNAMLTVFCDGYGEAKVVYVRAQDVNDMYWKTETLYDSTNKVTKRVPDADGYYWYDLAVNGECKTFKTKDPAIANKMDSYYGAFGLNVIKDNEITGFVSTSSVKNVKGNGVNGYCVTAINGNKITLTYNKPGSSFGKTETVTLSSGTKIYDVSPSAENFGEVTQLKVGDTVRTYLSRDEKTHSYVYVMARSTREGGEVGYCEVCKKEVTWNPIMNSSSMTYADGHWYVTDDMTSFVQQTFATTSKDYTICLDLNGKTLTRSANGRMFRVAYGETLNIMDSVGGGKIVTGGGTSFNGGMFLLTSGGTINVYGGTFEFVQGEYKNGNGGIVYMSGEGTQFNLYDGVITGGVSCAQGTEKNGAGGNVFISDKAEFNMYGGVVKDGKTYGCLLEKTNATTGAVTYSTLSAYGGNFYIAEGAQVNLLGGSVLGGEAVREDHSPDAGRTLYNNAYGGSIYQASASGVLNIQNATVSGGRAHRGGNIYGVGGTVTLDGAILADGVATQFGGNIMSTAGVYTIKGNSQIVNGECSSTGGNIYSQGGEYTVENATISGGKGSTGGNIYLYKNKTAPNVFTIKEGALIASGVATGHGGNIYVKNKNYEEFEGKVYDHGDVVGTPLLPTLNIEGGEILNGVCGEGSYGGNIYCAGHLNLTGGRIAGGLEGTDDYDIYITGEREGDVVVGSAQVEGKFRVNGPKSFTLSGAPKLGQLNLNANVVIEVGELTQGADVKVVTTTTSPVFTTSFANAQAYLDAEYFSAYDSDSKVTVTNNSELQVEAKPVIDWCDHCNSDVEWVALSAGSGEKIGTSGHYFLTEDQSWTSHIYAGLANVNTAAEGAEVVIDLKGHNITSTNGVFYVYKNHTLVLMDSVGTAQVTGQGASLRGAPRNGGLFYLENGTLKIYGGTYNFQPTSDQKCGSGGVIYAGGPTYLYGGTFNGNGGTLATDKSYYGDTIYAAGSRVLYIGDATINGEVYTSSGTILTLSGKPVISELDLSNGAVITLDGLQSGANVSVIANGEFTNPNPDAQAYLDAGYIKSGVTGKDVTCVDNVLLIAETDPNTIYAKAQAMTFNSTEADGKVTAVCPVCEAEVDWYPLDTVHEGNVDMNKGESSRSIVLAEGHYYLSESVDYTQNIGHYSMSLGQKVCLHLNGQTMVSSYRTFYTETDGTTLNIMGDGTVRGASNGATNRGVLDMTRVLNLYGGTYESTSATSPAITARSSSTLCVVSVYEGTTIKGETAVYVTKNSTLNICGGTVNGKIYTDSATATIALSGAAVLSELDLTGGYKVTIGELTTGASIKVVADGVFTNDMDNPAAALPYVTTDLAEKVVDVNGKALAVVADNDPNMIYEESKTMTFNSTEADGKVTANCPVCGTSADWYPLDTVDTARKLYDTGTHKHFYLAENKDYTQNKNFYFIKSNTKVCLHLNGQNVVSTGRVFVAESEHTVLNIMGDGTVTGGTATYTASTGNHSGSALDATAPINLYGGTYTSNSSDYPVLSNRGSKTYSVVNIYEGTTIARYADGVQGPNVMITDNGTVNMYGGQIIGGTAIAVGSVSETEKFGGNVLVKPNMKANSYTAAFNLYGGLIADGTAETKGGNIAVIGNTQTQPNACVNIMGGNVANGSVYVSGNNASLRISGDAQVDYLDAVDANLIDVSDLDGAQIKVVAADDVAFTGTIVENADAYAKCFYVDDLKKGVVVKDDALVVTNVCPHCGVAMTDITWTDIANTNATHKITESGHYRLTEDIVAASGNLFTFDNGTATNHVDMVLDTCGFDLTATKGRAFYVTRYNKVTVFDSVGGSVASSNSTNNALGGSCLITYDYAEFNIYDLTFNGAAGANGKGNCISVYGTGSIVNIYSGNFVGTDNATSGTTGGTIYNHATLNIYGGTFNGVQMNNGLGGCMYSDGTLNIYGGEFQGDVYVAGGTLELSGVVKITQLQLVSGVKANLSTLEEGTDITVSADGEFAEGTNAMSYVEKGYIKPVTGKKITESNNVLSMSNESTLQAVLRFFGL